MSRIVPSKPAAEEVFYVRAIQSYKARKKGELSFKIDQIIEVRETNTSEYLHFGVLDGKEGWFPYFYVKLDKKDNFENQKLEKETKLKKPSLMRSKAEKKSKDITIKSGMVGKRTGRQFKQRYLVLKPSGLYYYQTQEDKKPVGKISKKNLKSVEFDKLGSKKSKLACFTVFTLTKKKGLVFGTNQQDCDEWIKMITEIISSTDIASTLMGINKSTEMKTRDDLLTEVVDIHAKTIEKTLSMTNLTALLNLSSTDSKTNESAVNPAKPADSEIKEVKKETLSAPIPSTKDNSAANNKPAMNKVLPALNMNQINQPSPNLINNIQFEPLLSSRTKRTLTEILTSNALDDRETLLEKLDRLKDKLDISQYLQAAAGNTEENEENESSIKSEKIITRKGLGKVRAKYDYIARSEAELSFRKNDEFILLEKKEKNGWWLGMRDNLIGHFSSNYVNLIEIFEEKENDSSSPNKSRRGEFTSPQSSLKGSISKKEKKEKKEKAKVSLLENFQIGERIGKGAFGSVFRGINVENGEMVAIKQFGVDKIHKKDIAAIMSELELLKELNHVNILSYKGFIRTSEHINIVLDFVEGGSLNSILAKFGPIPEKLAICYVKQILHGLDYLHSRGVIHRDIKCGNILVTKDGSVKLADFGIATGFGSSSTQATGSPYWMSPEVIEMKPSDSSADIWALGCTIIELLTGQPPYYEFNQVQAMFCMVENERPPFPPEISKELYSFLNSCFQRNPKDRWTAKQLLKHSLIRSPSDIFSEDERFISPSQRCNTFDLDFDGVDIIDQFGLNLENDISSMDNFNFDAFENLENFDESSYASSEDVFTDLTDFDESELSCSSFGDSGDEFDDDVFGSESAIDEKEILLLTEDHLVQELLNLFHNTMDKGNVSHIILIRKFIRHKLEQLIELQRCDQSFEILVQQVGISLVRCEDEYGEFIPVDSDDE